MTLLHALGSNRNGGAETFFLSLIDGLNQQGLPQAAVIKPHQGRADALQAMGIACRTAPFGGLIDPVTGMILKNMARRLDVRTILTWMSRASWHAPLGPSHERTRVIARVGGFYNIKYFKACDHIIVNAPMVSDHLVAQGWPVERITLIPNFPAVDPNISAVSRESLSTPSSAPLIVALGRLHPVKGLDTLIQAVARIDGAYLWIAGDGDEGPALRRLADDLGVSDRVRFLGWRTDRSAILQAADIVAFPSRREPFGSVVVEAWASGKPLVASDVDGPAWLIDHGETGLLTPPEDVDTLRSHLKSLIDEPEEARRLAANGLRQVESTYSRDRIITAYREVLFPQGSQA
jgi:glycosyltransferase involved in cell wall biosynthesis